jgi:ABC-type transport system involved in multi-copper enzyme maturation permease subunit
VIAAFRSEWIRFRKTALTGIVIIVAFTALVSVFLFVGADGVGDGGGRGFGAGANLAEADAAVAALVAVLDMIGIVSLSLFALSVARDFELGTIRSLLVAQPKRGVLLSGKLLALSAFVVAGVALGAFVSVALAFGFAPGQGIPTDSWTLLATFESTGLVATTTVLYGLIGAALAMVTRSAATSITVGVGYLLIAERLIGLIWDTAGDWLPAGILEAFAAAGSESVSFGKAWAFVAIYAILALGVTFFTFLKRDITS